MVSMDQDTVIRDAIIAYGPLPMLSVVGMIGGLCTALLFRVAHRISSSPTVTSLAIDTAGRADTVRLLPLHIFALLGLLLALASRSHRRLWSDRLWWRVRWEWLVGILAFGLLAGQMLAPMGWSLTSLVPLLFAGLTATIIWSGIYDLLVGILASYLWREVAEGTVRHLARYLRIPASKFSRIEAMPVGKDLHVSGRFSEAEGERLQMGLLVLLPEVRTVRVNSSFADQRVRRSEALAFSEFTRTRREAVIQRKSRREELADPPESISFPWPRRPARRWSRSARVLVAVLGVLLVWGLWELGLLNPIRPEELERDLETFFRYRVTQGSGGSLP